MTAGSGPDLSRLTPEQRALVERRMLESRLAAGKTDVIPRRTADGDAPLSFAQERLWVVEQLAAGSPAYHVVDAFRVEGELDATALRRALEELTARQGALRTTFPVVDGQPMQVVAAPGQLDFQEATLASPEDAFEQEVRRLLIAESGRPFDLEHGPVFRVRVFHAGASRHVLLLAMHHIVSDAWSRDVLFRELSALYAAFTRGASSPLAELPIQYADFAEWQRDRLASGALAEQMAYWRRQLAGLPALELPAARPRGASHRGRGGSVHTVLPRPLASAIKGLCRAENATVSMLALAALDVLLQRYCGQDDVVVGSPVAGRDREELNDLVGFFVNMLVLRTRLDGDPTVRELFDRVRTVVLDAHERQEIPFEKLVEELEPDRDVARNPLFQVAFQYGLTGGTPLASSGLTIEPIGVGLRTTRFDLEAHVWERGEDVLVAFVYDEDLFDATTIERMLEHYRTLLEGFVADPERRISRLPMLSGEERRELVVDRNRTEAPYERDRCIHELIEARASEAPESIAVEMGETRLTYAELNARANRVAHTLRDRGVGPDTLVGLCVDRSPEMVVGLLGILKAGGAYLPLDPAYPRERLEYMLTDSGVRILLTRETLLGELPEHGAETLCLDRDWPTIAQASGQNPPVVTATEHLAYVIYTSGSTGLPKGTMVAHRGLASLSEEQARRFGVDASSRVLQFSSLSFDASTFDVMMALPKGAALILGEPRALTPGPDLCRFLVEHRISIVTLPPTALAALPEAELPDLAAITVAGEACPAELAARWAPGRRFFNLYGPTEATIWSTAAELCTGEPSHIGRPIGNVTAYVLDDRGGPVPDGVAGELYIGGIGVARGYLGRPDLTAERFVPDPFSGREGSRLYRSGDRVRWRSDGNLEFLGRIDDQVKLRGFRIEPGEIEAALCRHGAVRESVVQCREDEPGEKRLVAYVVMGEEDAPAAILRNHLRETLPDHMIPAAFVRLEALPVTPNGKVDRRALPAPEGERQVEEAYVAPRSEFEARIAAIWREVLGVEQVGIHDNFFDLGGHSLRLVRVHARLREELDDGLSMTELFQHPTVAAVAERLRRGASSAPGIASSARARAGRRGGTATSAVAVIGLAGRFPGAADVETLWANLESGVESIRFFTDDELRAAGLGEATLRNPSFVKAHGALEGVELFDARHFGYTPREAELIDPQQRIFLECAWHALERAGYDPERFDGLIGVYAGASANAYLDNVRSHPELLASAGLSAVLSSAKDYLPTRVSYKLNLRGPSMNIQTACSTSLVAVHEACRSLLDHQCDIALAGGVSVSVPTVGGYFYREGDIGSPDGHCRTFDAGARGTLRGDGAGIVVLKRLDEALRDGDEVHAVILGTAVNNDGSNKVGYTAPSGEGQAEVVAMAQAAAAVDPETITYVEAHGTATQLGDPIEVAALTRVFRESTDRTGFCGLSALKSNIGHLDAAAGVAGLIKTVQALEHRTLPPVLHFERPNPEIDFESSPFYVVTERRDWEVAEGTPRRAGVSAFGLGGTNAHTILEEAPVLAPSEPSRGWQLFVLSAKTEEALDALASDLAAHLEAHGGDGSVNLADVAYTLQVGRRELEYRRSVRCRDVAEAIAALAGERPELVHDDHVTAKARPVTFLFPGQGTQHVNMGVESYREPGAFREAADACFRVTDGELGLGLREVLYPDDPLTEAEAEALGQRLERTSLAQPALFIVSYATARQWMAWGIEPESMIGHSIGEYVAACVSGVLSVEDAVRLVVARGRFMEAMPAGVMTAVPLPPDRVEALLDETGGEGLWLSVVNAPSTCVVSGTPERVAALEARLSAAGTECRRLHTSHAFHSGLMDGAVDPFVELVLGITVHAPLIPYLSNVSGDWITAADVRDASYWGRQLRQPVRFAEGMERVLEDTTRVLLEVGPGRVLGGLARLQASFGRERVAVSSLGRAGSGEPATSAMAEALGRLWAGGVAVDWARVHGGARRRRVTLPTYPFQRERYWVERRYDGAPGASRTGSLVRRADLGEWFYTPVWRRSRTGRPSASRAPILVFARDADLDRRVVARLAESGRAVVVVRVGASFQAGDGSYVIDPAAPDDYARLLAELQRASGLPGEIVHLWTLSFETHRLSAAEADALDERGLRSLLHLARAIESLDGGTTPESLRIDVVTDGAQEVTGHEPVQPEKAAALGFCRIAPLELSGVACRGIDLAPGEGPAPDAEFAKQVARECLSAAEDPLVAYRDGRRWVQSFVRVELDAVESEPPSRLRDQGVYLVTGGLGGMGLELAGELARAVQARLVLTSRTGLPAREDWSAHLGAPGDDEATIRTRRAIEAIEEMERTGAEVMVTEADVTDLDRMRAVVEEARERFGRIDGVLHMAGVPGGGAVSRAGSYDLARTFAPKVSGARVLEELFRETPLDFMVLTSSLITSWGVAGWIDYCAANTYLDAFARRFAADTGTYTVAIDWTRWREAGMAVDLARAAGQAMTAQGVSSREGVEAFRRILDRFDGAQVLVSEVDFRDAMSPRRMRALEEALAEDAAPPELATEHLHARPKLATEHETPRNETEEKLAAIWQGLFGIDGIGVHDNFFDLGGDSVLGIQIVARAKGVGLTLGPNSLFEHPTIAELAAAAGEGSSASTFAEQGPVVGEVPLTPIQHWFFEQGFAEAHHFNQSNMLTLRTRLSASQWEEVLRFLVGHHDALRLRYAREGGTWLQRCVEPEESVPLEFVDLADRAEADHRAAIEARSAELQRSLDLVDGPIARFAVFDPGPAHPQRLLIVVHHLAMDAVSWAFLFQDIARLVEQVDRGEPRSLPAKTTSFQAWSRRLTEHAQTAALTEELAHWSSLPWDEVRALPVDHPADHRPTATHASVGVSLDEDATRRLLRSVPRTSGAQVPEVLLTAVAHALATWTGYRTSLIDVEGHGREPLFEDVDLTRTVGWFTSMVPVLLSAEPGGAPGGALASVKERMRAVSERGIGYGLLRYVHEDNRIRQRLATLPEAQVAFLYFGQADASADDDGDDVFTRAVESVGPEQSPHAQRPHLLELMGGVVGGRLQLEWTYSTAAHERATIEKLAAGFMDALRALIGQPTSASDDRPPLSFAQQRLWILDQLGMGAAYNMPLVLRLTGRLDVDALEHALATVVERHEVLRTTFSVVDGEPVQVIAPSFALRFQVDDLRDLPEADREDEARRRAIDESERPFDLSRGPLLRPLLYRLEEDEHILLLAMHHLVTDGWSLAVLVRELTELYRTSRTGERPDIPDLPLQYADFARWQRDPVQIAALEEQLRYWREHLGGDRPLLQLPTDRPRPAVQTFDGDTETFLLPDSIRKALKERSREHGATLAMTVMAAFKTLLLRYTGQDDVVVGSPIGNRTREELEPLIGFFVNTLAMRTDLSGDPSFSELLRREKSVALGAYANQDLPFERLVEDLAPDRDLSQNPIFTVMLAMQNAPQEALQLGDVTIRPVHLGSVTTRFDLEVYLRELPEGLHALLIYNRELFDASTIARLGGHFANLLTAVAEDPSKRLSRLPMLGEGERTELVAGWGEAGGEGPAPGCLHERFEEQAAATPDAIALSCDGQTITYDELNRRANQIAHALRRRGVGPEVLVGLCVDRTVEMVVGVLGILKAGGAYVPLDPTYPEARLALMLEDARAPVLLTLAALEGVLPPYGGDVLHLDAGRSEIAGESEANPPARTTATNRAYVIYTSGSTGRPKGVMITHASAAGLVHWARGAYGDDELRCVLASTSICFDLSVFEIFVPLSWGGSIVLAADALALAEHPDRDRVTLINTVPSAIQALVREGAVPRSVRTVNLAGEPLSPALVDQVYACGVQRVIDLYGPSEDTTYSTWAVREPGGPETIGRPIAGERVYVVDDWLEPVPLGVPGELLIGGAGLARGYLGRPDATAEKFIPDPFAAETDPKGAGAFLYRTGDLARYRPDGNLEFLGRRDAQVKLRGYRIELGEIETALVAHPGVAEAVAMVREDRTGDRTLVAYVVAGEGKDLTGAELRGHLREQLPDYMVPSSFVVLDALPMTQNGKVDRRALPAPSGEREATVAYLAPRGEVEDRVAAIWRDVLGVEEVGVRDNFFDLGGHSLRAIQVHARLQTEFDAPLQVLDMFRYPTVEALAGLLSGGAEGERSLRGEARARIDGGRSVGEGAIAIVGMAGRFPDAPDVETFWENLRAGKESIHFFSDAELREAGIPEVLIDHPDYVPARGVLADADLFDAWFFGYSPSEAEIIDPQQRVFLECAWEALERAGYDPARYPGLIGVYAGTSINSYLVNLLSRPAKLAASGAFQTLISNDKDFLATRVSYKLNLRGPSMNVQTACSTSLVAIHEACCNLLENRCDMALAGGVSVTVPTVGGYMHTEGGIASPDGHCRTFDARARGTVGGNGVGVVVLKRVADAVRDGDVIHAVIRGTAINNDGSDKVGFTAPSMEGQAEVIALAQAAAGVEPDTIEYVEAHGTGTALGDPIEVEALTRVFREDTARKGFCALGSLKSNMGHLDAASGVGGVIKATLAIEHCEIPPSLHYEEPNPEIDFAGSPFFVPVACRAWNPEGGRPRRAGVSSFGIGGTNAHAVLEQAPAPAPSGPARDWQLVVLSAKSPTALEQQAKNLAVHLRDHPDVNLADVAHTLQIGRAELECRRALAARSAEEAAALLEGAEPAAVVSRRARPAAHPVVFLFPGQGAQYVGMGRGLYGTEPAFREVVDECLALLLDELGLDLRPLLLPTGEAPPDAEEQLARTEIAQPALFVVEYALAQLWRSWGVEPEACIGHSVGEYVAAVVSGVLGRDHALRLVALRGRLMGGMPVGVMTAVPLPAARVSELLAGETDLWLSAVNGPSACVVSGTAERVAAFEADLQERDGIPCRRLRTSHAFHSGLMDGAVDPFVAAVREVPRHAPRIPYVSNLTGTWITEQDVQDASYWGRHIRHAVRFSEGLQHVLEDPNRVLLEVGPGEVLGGLARQHEPGAGPRVVVPTLRRPASAGSEGPEADGAFLTRALGRLWAGGVAVDWARYRTGEERRRVVLPSYPFQRERYWIEPESAARPAQRAVLDDWFYVPGWRRAALPAAPPVAPPEAVGERSATGHVLVFTDPSAFSKHVIAALTAAGWTTTLVEAADGYRARGDGFAVAPGSLEDLRRLVDALAEAGRMPERIVHLWGAASGEVSAVEWEERGFHAVLNLARTLGETGGRAPIDIDVVTTGVQEVLGQECVEPAKALVLGPCRVIGHELSDLRCRNIDLDARDVASEPGQVAERLIGDLLSGTHEPSAWRGSWRYVETFARVPLDAQAGAMPQCLREGGTYLVTGGMGGIGLELAGLLARELRANLVLVGRTPLPPRDDWARVVDEGEGDADDAVRGKLVAIQAMKAAGAQVMTVSADVADLAAMEGVVTEARRRFGAIHGVVHASGVAGGGVIQLKEREEANRVLRPKVAGTRVLERLFADGSLDFLLLCSSLTAVTGDPGQVDYTAANAYLDAFARRFLADTGTLTVSVNWNRWREVGMAVDAARDLGLGTLREGASTGEGLEAFRRILGAGVGPQVAVCERDLIQVLAGAERPSSSGSRREEERQGEDGESTVQHARPDIGTEYVAAQTEAEQALALIWQGLLGIDRVGVLDDFFDLGGHSLLATQLLARVRDAFQVSMVLGDVFEARTLGEFAALVEKRVLDEIEELTEEEATNRLGEEPAGPMTSGETPAS